MCSLWLSIFYLCAIYIYNNNDNTKNSIVPYFIGNVGYEQEVSEIEKKVLHSDSSDSTWVAQSLDDPSFNSHDTKATTPPRCGK